MKRHINSWLVMFLAISLALPIYSMAQMKLTLQSSSGDTIGGAPAKAFSLGPDNNLVVYLDGPFTSADLLPTISVDGTTYSGCTVSPPASVSAIQGATIIFRINSTTAGASFSGGSTKLGLVVDPEPAATSFATITPTAPNTATGIFTWTTGGTSLAPTGSYLAVFQATDGANTSQLVVMIKINPQETVTPPTTISPSTGTVNQATNFTASGATVSTSGHTVEYRFNWGDNSGWSSWGSSTQTHTYASAGQFTIQAQARCATDQVESTSYSTTVTISTIPTYTVSASVVNSAGGSVSPMSLSGITSGGTATFTVTTNSGYTASVSPGSLSGSTWTISNVTSNLSATITFTQSGGGGGALGTKTNPYKINKPTTQITNGYIPENATDNSRGPIYIPAGAKVFFVVDPVGMGVSVGKIKVSVKFISYGFGLVCTLTQDNITQAYSSEVCRGSSSYNEIFTISNKKFLFAIDNSDVTASANDEMWAVIPFVP